MLAASDEAYDLVGTEYVSTIAVIEIECNYKCRSTAIVQLVGNLYPGTTKSTLLATTVPEPTAVEFMKEWRLFA